MLTLLGEIRQKRRKVIAVGLVSSTLLRLTELDFAPMAQKPGLYRRWQLQEMKKAPLLGCSFLGAATQIRTGDLILTKDVLYQLSHSSKSQEYFLVTQTIIAKI